MKIGSSLASLSAYSYSAVTPVAAADDDDGNASGRRASGDARMTGAQTVSAPALSQALWDMNSGGGVSDAPFLSKDAASLSRKNDALSDDLHKWATMSFAEKIRAQYLERKGLSESDLAAMPPEERQAIEDEIRKEIMRAMGVGEEAESGSDTTKATAA